MNKTLAQHLSQIPAHYILQSWGDLNLVIIAPFEENASLIKVGGVFLARPGRLSDGAQFIPQAIQNGAVAIIGESPMPSDCPVPYVQVQNAKDLLGLLAASYYDFPSRDLIVIGVTGTDGKTTTSTLIYNILKAVMPNKVGIISTISADFGDTSLQTGLHVTTPTAPEVQAYLAMMRSVGLTHVVLEMTSHGLHQGRLNAVELDIAVLTNITHEHLDYHGTFENYREAKGLLFDRLSQSLHKPNQPKISVVNHDDPNYAFFASKPSDIHLSYGIDHASDYTASQIEYTPQGTRFVLNGYETINTYLFGRFNVLNTLAAIAVARALGIQDVQTGLNQVQGVSGRMQAINEGQNFIAMVDFAHTPNALKNVLETARQMLPTGKRLISVFGSAGLRDVEKRRLMAETSAQLADMSILTAEDPRTESLDAILEMMAQGCIKFGGVEGKTFLRVPDRGEALYQACQMAQSGDMVVACGKGHEQSMCFGTIEYDWDDREALRSALRGTPLKTLPTANPAD
jgi:UDP-N-acetylmuramoyl-L-alanyl-D-glutamate--2,6-diaminopimelate ligase